MAVRYTIPRILFAVSIPFGLTLWGFVHQSNQLNKRKEESLALLNRVKEEERYERIMILKQQGKL